jgi:hypothetical protein
MLERGTGTPDVREYGSVNVANPKGSTLRAIIPSGLFTKEGSPLGMEYQQQITQLLRSASPSELRELQRLSAFDPKIKAALTIAGVTNATGIFPSEEDNPKELLRLIAKFLGEK